MEWIVGIYAILTAVFGFLEALFLSQDMKDPQYRPGEAVAWMGREEGKNFLFVVAAGILFAAGGMAQTIPLVAAILGGLAIVCLVVFLIRIRPRKAILMPAKLKRRLYLAIVLSFAVGAVCIISGWMLSIAGAAVVSPFYLPVSCGLFRIFGKKKKQETA